jgi:hypothetical protein
MLRDPKPIRVSRRMDCNTDLSTFLKQPDNCTQRFKACIRTLLTVARGTVILRKLPSRRSSMQRNRPIPHCP